jgi:hypothetical protein
MGEVGRGMLKAPKQPFSSSGSQSSNVGWSILKWQRRRPVIDVYPALRGKPSDMVPKGGRGGDRSVLAAKREAHNGSRCWCGAARWADTSALKKIGYSMEVGVEEDKLRHGGRRRRR